MTACTARASFSGEPRQQQGRRHDGQPTSAASSRSWAISASHRRARWWPLPLHPHALCPRCAAPD
eukprot:6255574-Prymnesium_polylepis.1